MPKAGGVSPQAPAPPPPPQATAPMPVATQPVPPPAAINIPPAPVEVPTSVPVPEIAAAAPLMSPPPPPVVAAPSLPSPTPPPYQSPAPVTAPAPDLAAQMSSTMGGMSGSVMPGDFFAGVDFTDVDDASFRLLPVDGTYEGVIEKVDPVRSTDGKPQLKVQLKTTFPLVHAGVRLIDYFSFEPSALWKLKSMARSCDMLTQDGSRMIPGTTPADFKDYVVRFNIRHDVYEGTPRNKVNSTFTAGYETPGLQASPSGAPEVAPPNTVAPPGQPAWPGQ